MFGGLYVSGALTGLLQDYLDSRGLVAMACRARLTAWPSDSRMPLAEWVTLLHLVVAEDPQPAIGLAIGQCIKPRHAGVIGYLALSCDTIGEALLRFERYHRLVYDGDPVRMDMEEGKVCISWGGAQSNPDQLADEVAMSAFATLTRTLVDVPVAARSIEFVSDAPSDSSPYEAFFGCPVRFGCTRRSATFSADYLALPIRHRDPGLRALLEQQADTLLRALPENDEFGHLLKLALLRTLHQGEPTLENVASTLHLSPRTLQRRLGSRSLSFHTLLETTRLALAQDYLANPTLSLTEIALLLGYSEQSAFTRAFRRWTGHTPRQARQP